MKPKSLSLLLLVPLLFASCNKEEPLTKAYFVGEWNLQKTEHLYHFDTGDTLVSHDIKSDLIYNFGSNDTVVITNDGDLIWSDSWEWVNVFLTIPSIHDDLILFNGNYPFRIPKHTKTTFTAVANARVMTYDNEGKKIEYDEQYTYYFEK